MRKISYCAIPFILPNLMLSLVFYLMATFSQAAIASSSVPEATILVTTLEDELNNDADCSLREAISAANTNLTVDACTAGDPVLIDIIMFDVNGWIILSRQIVITNGGPLFIIGDNMVFISGDYTTRVFFVEGDAHLNLESLKIVNGCDADIESPGAGIYNLGTIIISDTMISGNQSKTYAGGIYNAGILTLTNSSVSVNYAQYGGGIINFSGSTVHIEGSTLSGNTVTHEGGGIDNGGLLTLLNSTLSGNDANNGGGAYNEFVGVITITYSTIAENTANIGGGLNNPSGIASVNNSIIADNGLGSDCNGQVSDEGHNISSDDTCQFNPANASMPSTNPYLGSLKDNGGPTMTHALLWISPAIDAGDDVMCPSTDQRGVTRPLDGNGDGLAACDIGAFESG